MEFDFGKVRESVWVIKAVTPVLELQTVFVRPGSDLRIMRCKNGMPPGSKSLKISDDERLSVAEVLYSIGNPHSLYGSCSSGKVVFPCKEITDYAVFSSSSVICREHEHDYSKHRDYRTFGDVLNKMSAPEKSDDMTYIGNFINPMVPIVLCANFDWTRGCYGGPIFRQNGEITGIALGGFYGFDVGVHVSAVKAIIAEAKTDEAKTRRYPKDGKFPYRGKHFDASLFVEKDSS